jgi:hypothetical protein
MGDVLLSASLVQVSPKIFAQHWCTSSLVVRGDVVNRRLIVALTH